MQYTLQLLHVGKCDSSLVRDPMPASYDEVRSFVCRGVDLRKHAALDSTLPSTATPTDKLSLVPVKSLCNCSFGE